MQKLLYKGKLGKCKVTRFLCFFLRLPFRLFFPLPSFLPIAHARARPSSFFFFLLPRFFSFFAFGLGTGKFWKFWYFWSRRPALLYFAFLCHFLQYFLRLLQRSKKKTLLLLLQKFANNRAEFFVMSDVNFRTSFGKGEARPASWDPRGSRDPRREADPPAQTSEIQLGQPNPTDTSPTVSSQPNPTDPTVSLVGPLLSHVLSLLRNSDASRQTQILHALFPPPIEIQQPPPPLSIFQPQQQFAPGIGVVQKKKNSFLIPFVRFSKISF